MRLCGRQPRCSLLDNNVSLGDSSWGFPRQLFLSFPAKVFSWQKSHGCFLSSLCHHLLKISSNSNDGFMGKVQTINEVSAADERIKYLPKSVRRERIYFLDGCVHTCGYRNRALLTEGFSKQILQSLARFISLLDKLPYRQTIAL
jgi:hypothetical protein